MSFRTLLCAASFVMLPLSAMAAAAPTVAVLPLDEGAGGKAYAGLGRALSGMIMSDLSTAKGVQLVERGRLDAILSEMKLTKTGFLNKKTAQKLGKGVGARYLVVGSYSVVKEKFLMDVRLVTVKTGKVVKAASAAGTAEDFVAVEKEVLEKLLAGLQIKLSGSAKRKIIVQAPTEKFDAFAAYGEGLERKASGDTDAAREAFQRALSIDPDFDGAKEALQSIKSVVASVKGKAQSAVLRKLRAAEDRILAEVRAETTRGMNHRDSNSDLAGFYLRMMAFENRGEHCKRYREMAHFLERKKFWIELPHTAAAAFQRRVTEFGFAMVPHDTPGPKAQTVYPQSRLEIFKTSVEFVLQGPLMYDDTHAGMAESLRKCLSAKKALAVLDKLERKAKAVPAYRHGPNRTYRAYTGRQIFDFAWLWIYSEELGADPAFERRIKAVLQASKNSKETLEIVERFTKAAEAHASSRAKRFGQSPAHLRDVVQAVADRDTKIIKNKGTYCGHLAKQLRSRAKNWLIYEKDIEKSKYGRRQVEEHIDRIGEVYMPMAWMGCVKGDKARFKNGTQAIRALQAAKSRFIPEKEDDQRCVHLRGALDSFDYDTMLKSQKMSKTHRAAVTYSSLTILYSLMSNQCVR